MAEPLMKEPDADIPWPPDYNAIYQWRINKLRQIRSDAVALESAKAFYQTHPVEFIEDWIDTFDPRLAGTAKSAWMPFIMFPRQREMVQFLQDCLSGDASGLVEKCRDMGATWLCAAFSVWLWLFWPGVSIGWGSRKETLVDKLGDPDSIFEKIRLCLSSIPAEFLPVGFKSSEHTSYMRIVNPETGATITGEAGDNIGRGGRKRIYFKDESAHYERPEKIEAALSDNTRVQIDISSVAGLGNVFHRKREAGVEWTPGCEVTRTAANVFIMDWSDHPEKTQEWYDERAEKAQNEGMSHLFAQEVDRDYAAAQIGVIIPAKWVKAAIDAHIKLGFNDDDARWMGSLDVGDDGVEGDGNAFTARKGVILRQAEEWGEIDTGKTTRKTVTLCDGLGDLDVQYDCIGVGAGVKAEVNRLKEDELMPDGIRFVPWNAGAGVKDPDKRVIPGDPKSPLNKEFYGNLKAQAWWELRMRFERTYRAVVEGVKYDFDLLISIDSTIPKLRTLTKQLSQATRTQNTKLQLIVNKKPEGTRSPNMADSVVQLYFPNKSGTLPLDRWV